MKIEDVLRLVDAGFSKADIIALASGQVTQISPQDSQTIETQTPPAPGPEPEQVSEPEPAPAEDQTQTQQQIRQMQAQIAAMQRANLQSAQQPEGANKPQTPEDVWKDFFEKGDK